jgi:hypothetical protein
VKGEYEYHDNESLLARPFNGFGIVFATYLSHTIACVRWLPVLPVPLSFTSFASADGGVD